MVVTLLLAWIINLTALGPVRLLRRWRVPRWLAATVVYLFFAGVVAVASFFVLPPLFGQIGTVAGQLTERARGGSGAAVERGTAARAAGGAGQLR